MSWRRILLLSLVLVLLLVGATWALLHRTTAATQIVQRELQALLLPTTSLGGTSLDLTRGRLTAEQLRIDDPTRPGTTLLAIDSAGVDIGPSFTSLLGVHGVVVDGFRIDLGAELPTGAQLLRPQPERVGGGGALQVPPIELRGGTVRIAVRQGEAPLELREVALHALPVDGRSDALQLRGSAALVDPAVPLQLVGEVDLTSGQAQLALTFGELAIDRALVLRLASLCGLAAPELELDARLRTATLVVRLPGGSDREPQFEFGAELAHARCVGGNLPRVIGDADLTVHGSSRDGGSATVHLRQQNQNGKLDVSARATDLRTLLQFEVRVSGTDVAIDSASLPALQLFPSGQEILRALQPTAGRADIELFLRNPHTSTGDTELELSLRDVAMSYHGFGSGEDRAGFPLPMERTRGRVRLRDSVILLEDVHASIAERAGGGSVRLQGRVETERPTGEDTTLDIQAESVTFCPDLRSALNELLDDGGALYDKFAPNGGAAVTVQIRPQSTLPGGWSVTVRPQSASMQWAGFPYRLDELQGSVRAQQHDVWFDLAGQHGDGKLTMRGHLPLGDQAPDANGFEAVIELADITVDEDLRRASAVLAPDLDRAWLDSAPTGRFGAQVKVWRQRPSDPLSHDARLDLHGLTLRLPTAPWQATGLQGQLFVQGSGNDTRVDFDALRGGLEHGNGTPAQLAMLGHLRLGSEAVTDLAFVVRDLALDDELGRTLQSLQALDQGTWNSLRPSGRIDLVCRYDGAEPQAQRLRLAVHLVDVASHAAILPRPAEQLTGELIIAGGELRFDDVRGRLGTSEVQCTGGRVRSRPAPDLRTEIAFAVTANGVPIDDGIANLFSGPLGQAVRERHLDGRADLDGLRLQFLLPQPGSEPAFETTIGGQLRLYDLDMTLGAGPEAIKVEGISGVVDLADSTVADRSGTEAEAAADPAAGGRLTGALRGMSLRVFGQPFEQLDAEFTADARELVLPQLRGKLHGGVVQHTRVDRPGLRYELPHRAAPEGQLAADLSVEKLDVYAFLERCGWQNPPYSGQASGKLDLQRLAGSDVLDAIGSGALVIDRADLGAVPLFTAIYAQLPAADRPRFDHLDAEFTFADKSVRFGRLDVRSTLLAAKGKGSLALDGYLDVEMTLDNLLGTSADPLVMPLIDYLAKNIVTFHLHGYLHDLQAEKRWVTESAPRRRPVMPMPPERPKVPPPGF